MPVDINRLTEGWLELESDPGLFTLLLEDFGVKGVQVEEIYDLQKSLEGPVYGFIFLFRWIEERRSRRKVVDQSETFVKDEDVVNNIFFAQQMVPNSCATHALLSVLLNCPNIHLGATLSRLKAHTSGMCPENKGWAIGNTPELAKAHNSHAMPQAKRRLDKSSGVSTGRYTGEAFHFVSYVPIHGKLFELDGLKPFPMDHGPWGDKEDWTEKFRRVITDRLGIATGEQYHDIRFNLMAVVPDRRLALVHKLKMLKTNRQIVLEALQQLVKLTHPELTGKDSTQNDERKDNENYASDKKDQIKLHNERMRINGIVDSEVKGTKQNLDDLDTITVSHPILETHNYAKIQLEPSSEINSVSPSVTNDSRIENEDSKSSTQGSNPASYSPSAVTHSDLSIHTQSELPVQKLAAVDSESTHCVSCTPGETISTTSALAVNLPTFGPQNNVSVTNFPASVSVQLASPTNMGSAHSHLVAEMSSQLSSNTPLSTSSQVVPTQTSVSTTHSISVSQSAPFQSVCTSQSETVVLSSISSQLSPSEQSLCQTASNSASALTSGSTSIQSPNPGSSLCPPGPPDYSTPLTIQTSPAPSTSSTDTSSEVGSAFNSPTQGWGWNSGQSSPTSTKDFKKFVVIRVAGSGEDKMDSPSARVTSNVNTNGKRLSADVSNAAKRVCLENAQRNWEKDMDKSLCSRDLPTVPSLGKNASSDIDVSGTSEERKVDTKICSKYPELFEPHTFAPKDLLALLKNLESEISVCEMNLRDENEKRKKYKIDDCRRTHNYDEFICTFLSMLAQQGKLADLVQQHLLLKKPGLPVTRVQRATKKPEARPSPSRRRRGRTKYRKRK